MDIDIFCFLWYYYSSQFVIFYIKGGKKMFEFECLTTNEAVANQEECRPFSGMCYPEVEGCCGPDCDPN